MQSFKILPTHKKSRHIGAKKTLRNEKRENRI